MQVCETPRCVIRHLCNDDHTFILKLLNSKGWLTFIGDRNVHDEAAAKVYIQNGPVRSYAQNGFGLYAVVLKESGALAGICGLIKRTGLDHPDIGFAFLERYEGAGLAFEACEAILKHHVALGIRFIQAITLKENVRSIRLLEKLGFTFENNIVLAGEQEELMLFRFENLQEINTNSVPKT